MFWYFCSSLLCLGSKAYIQCNNFEIFCELYKQVREIFFYNTNKIEILIVHPVQGLKATHGRALLSEIVREVKIESKCIMRMCRTDISWLWTYQYCSCQVGNNSSGVENVWVELVFYQKNTVNGDGLSLWTCHEGLS